MSEKHIKLKLYGESFKIHSLEIKKEYLEKVHNIAKQINEPLHSALLNVKFFRRLNIKEYKTIQDFVKNTFSGLIKNDQNQIEIWIGKKRIEKFMLDDLFHSQTIFPLYQTQLNDIGKLKLKSGLFLIEREVGLIGQYEVKVKNFNIELLLFQLVKFEYSNTDYEILNNISYDKIEVPLLKFDSFLRNQTCFYINK